MLIELHDDLSAALPLGKCRAIHLEVLQRLHELHRKGQHLVTGTSKTLEALGNLFPDDKSVQNGFNRMAKYSMNLAALRKDFPPYILIRRLDGHILDEQATTFDVPLEWFHPRSELGSCTLMGENLSDAKLYASITKACFGGPSSLEVTFALRAGNGSQVGVELKYAASQSPVFCVVDSDRKVPNDPLGPTARAATAAANALKSKHASVVEVYCLEVHELENLLPVRLLEDFWSHPQYANPKALSQLAHLKSLDWADARFMDLKQHNCDPDMDNLADFLGQKSRKQHEDYFFGQKDPRSDEWRSLIRKASAWGLASPRPRV